MNRDPLDIETAFRSAYEQREPFPRRVVAKSKAPIIATYIGLIVAVNWAFSVVPLLPLPGGEMFPPVSLLVGFIFVARDLAQRTVGHHVIWAMLVGVGLSYILADPYVATASAVAFAISEFIDWAAYTVTKRPLSDRILWSSALATPVDSSVFLLMIGAFGWLGFLAMTLSKMVGSLIVWATLNKRGIVT